MLEIFVNVSVIFARLGSQLQEKFDDTIPKGIIGSRKSKKDWQRDGTRDSHEPVIVHLFCQFDY